MIRIIQSATLVSILMVFNLNLAQAVNMADRLGVGYSNAFISKTTGEAPSVQLKYFPKADISFIGAFHASTADSNSSFGALVKGQKIIFQERQMNFFVGLHGAFMSIENLNVGSDDTESGFELAALVGVEFFLQGLENLGITFEAGFGMTTLGEGITFKTVADHPFRAGMVFYF